MYADTHIPLRTAHFNDMFIPTFTDPAYLLPPELLCTTQYCYNITY